MRDVGRDRDKDPDSRYLNAENWKFGYFSPFLRPRAQEEGIFVEIFIPTLNVLIVLRSIYKESGIKLLNLFWNKVSVLPIFDLGDFNLILYYFLHAG